MAWLVPVLVLALLAGCSSGQKATTGDSSPSSSSSSSGSGGEKVTLKILGFESCITDGMQKQADAYMAQNPNVTVVVDKTAYTNLHEKQVLELAAGTGNYDMYSIVADWMPEYLKAGYLEPLDDYLAANPIEGWPNVYSQGLLNFQIGADGKLHGLPNHAGPQLMYYRKDLFEDPANQEAFKSQYGYDLKAPETWQQFLDQAKFFSRPDQGITGTVLTAKFGEQQLAHDFWLLLASFGGGTGFDAQGNPTFNGAEGVKALQFYHDLIKTHKVAPEASLTFGIPEAGDYYLAGKAALHFNWSHIGAFAELPDQSQIVGKNGYTLIPVDQGVKQHPIYNSYWVLGIAKTSKKKQAAYDFMRFAATPSADKLMADAGCIPTRLSSWNDPELLKKFPFYAQFQPAYAGFSTSSPRIPEYEKVNDLMQRYISKVLAGEMDAQSALDGAVQELIPILKEGGHL